MARPVVLLNRAEFYPPGWIKKHWPTLSRKAEIRLSAHEGEPEYFDEVAAADVLFARTPSGVDRQTLAAGKKLRGVVAATVGYDKIDVAAASELGIVVANSPGNTDTMAEATILLVLALAKQLPLWIDAARNGTRVASSVVGTEILGKTIGIVGFGRIGRATAERAKALGMNVLAYGPRLLRSDLAEVVSLDDLLRRSDYVSLHAVLTSETRRMIDGAGFALMKPSSFIVNTARGELVDEAALIDALRDGRIVGAGLDVFEVEPPTTDNPLVSMPNVIATPHRVGHSAEARLRCARLAEQSILALLDGRLPEYAVNPEINWRGAGSAAE